MYIVRPVGANLVWSKTEKEHLQQASLVLKSCFQLMEHYNYNKFCISEDEKIGRYDFMKLMHLFCRIANSSIVLEANNDEWNGAFLRLFFFFEIFRRISSKFYFCQIFHHAKLLSHYYAKLLPHYHTKSLKSNFLTPKSYLAPATVKFYTVSNFINKLQTSWEAGSWVSNFTNKLELHFLKTYFSYL